MHHGQRQVFQAGAAGVQVADEIDPGENAAHDEIGERLAEGAQPVAREDAVEVAAVDRREAAGGDHGLEIEAGDDDDEAIDGVGIEVPRGLHERDRPFVFVAMDAARQQIPGAIAIAHHDDGNHLGAVGRALGGIRRDQIAIPFAVTVQRYRRLDTRVWKHGFDLRDATRMRRECDTACLVWPKAIGPTAAPAELGDNFGDESDRLGVTAGGGFEVGIEGSASGAQERAPGLGHPDPPAVDFDQAIGHHLLEHGQIAREHPRVGIEFIGDGAEVDLEESTSVARSPRRASGRPR